MKKPILTLSLSMIMIVPMFINCNSSAVKEDKVLKNDQEVENNLAETKMDLIMVPHDTINSYQKFKKESEKLITNYEKDITELKERISKEKNEDKANLQKQLTILEKKNNDLRNKLNGYYDDGTDSWMAFKKEFKHDLDDLGKAFSDFTKNNIK